MKKFVISIIVIIVILSGIRLGIIFKNKENISKQEINKVAVKTELLRKGYIASKMKFVGFVKGENQVQVFPDTPGKIIQYLVKEGNYVKKGDVIALIDRSIPGMEYEPSKVKSPIDGIVLRLPVDIGMTVAPQVPIAYIGNTRNIVVSINVGEKFYHSIKKGQKAIIKTDNGEKYGYVSRISPFIDPQTSSCYCEITVEDPKDLIIGSIVEVYVIVKEKKDAYILPINALIEDLKTNEKYIFVVQDSIAIKKFVKTGIITEDYFEIMDTLPESTEVVTIGKEFLKDSTFVYIVK